MENQNSIRYRLANFFLKKKIKNSRRSKSTQTPANSKTALIIFDVLNTQELSNIKNFAKWLSEQGIKINFLGYAATKEPIDKIMLDNNETCFNKKDCNWLMQPKTPSVNELLKQQFDLHFEFFTRSSFPLHYCSALANAKFKTGIYAENANHLDFMINLGNDQSIAKLTIQLKQYLSQLKV